MTTNKPEVLAYHHINKESSEHRGVSLRHDASCIATLIRTEPLSRLSDYEALQAECEKLRKDAERYRYIRKGNQWIVAATQTGVHLDGEVLDELVDSEMEQQK